MGSEQHEEENMNQHNEESNTAGHSIAIHSKELGKENATVLRQRFDKNKNGDNEINAVELGEMAQEVNQKDQTIHFYKYALMGSIVSVALLLCTSFATAWLAVKLQKDLDADNDQKLLISKRSGDALATLVHNPMVTIDFDFETWNSFFGQRRLLSQEDLQRHLQETPVFTVPAKNVRNLWGLYTLGNLGRMQFSSNSPSSNQIGLIDPVPVAGDGNNGIVMGLVGTELVTRYSSRSMVTYGNIFPIGYPDAKFQVRCPSSISEPICQGYATALPLSYVGLCFSPFSTVELENGEIKSMQSLEIGDKVLVGPNKYQEIYSFGHKLLEKGAADKFEFRKVTVARQDGGPTSSSVLELTLDHLIYLHEEDTPVPASLLEETDWLVGQDGGVLHIRKIETVYHHGLYSPLTADGTIVVGGALASIYPSFNKDSPNLILAGVDTGISWHSLEHAFLKPFAFYCTALVGDGCYGEAYTDDGYNYATFAGVSLVQYLVVEESNLVLQAIKVVLAAIALSVIAFSYAVACLFESYAALLAVLFGGFGYASLVRILCSPHVWQPYGKKQLWGDAVLQ